MNAHHLSEGDRFWGHILLKFPAERTPHCYPISAATRRRIGNVLRDARPGHGWITIDTLANRVLLLNPLMIQRICLVDDGDEWPNDMVPVDNPAGYAGLPIDLYELIALWADDPKGFSHDVSSKDRKAVAAQVASMGFAGRPEALAQLLRHTIVHFADGTCTTYEASREALFDLAGLELVPEQEIVELPASEDGCENFFPLGILRMIEIPDIELAAARRELLDEDESNLWAPANEREADFDKARLHRSGRKYAAPDCQGNRGGGHG